MAKTIRTLNDRGETVGIRVVPDAPWGRPDSGIVIFTDQFHPVLSTANGYELAYEKYRYITEQLALNGKRTGNNLVDPDTTRHILEGVPITRTVRSKSPSGEGDQLTATITGWSGGHGNPDAAKYGKTQIPSFWTNDRFMYEVSDVLSDNNTRWFRQEASPTYTPEDGSPERYVCVEERFGVPIRVVADRIDDEFRCVTAFPDFGDFPLDQRFGVAGNEPSKKNRPRKSGGGA